MTSHTSNHCLGTVAQPLAIPTPCYHQRYFDVSCSLQQALVALYLYQSCLPTTLDHCHGLPNGGKVSYSNDSITEQQHM